MRFFIQRILNRIARPLFQPSAADERGKREALFLRQFQQFSAESQSVGRPEKVDWQDRYPCLEDCSEYTGFDRHYTYHPAWAARIVAKTHPKVHVDISSSLTFCSMLSAFIPVEFYDFRPAPLFLDNLVCGRQDVTQLSFADESIPSLSCMHVVEHIGLGRYGDPLDPMGDLKALAELSRVVSRGGNLLLAVPVGKERIQFNAHRIYGHRRFISYLPDLKLRSFSLIPDGFAPEGMRLDPTDEVIDSQDYGCGCYWFVKE